jgi:F-type H+-transporting ATPase subunit a
MVLSSLPDTLKTVADTANAGKESGGGWILHHVMDANYVDFGPLGKLYLPKIELFGIDLSITKDVFFLWVVAVILVILLFFISRGYKKSLIPKGITNLFEIMIIFVRDEVVRPAIGKGYEVFMPYMLSLFFFILFVNMFGLIPTPNLVVPTGNIGVTASLALISFIAIQVGGIRNLGFFHYLKSLVPKGMPGWIIIIMIPLEVLGLFTKPFALCIRLFANMIAGHIVIFSLLGLIFIMRSIYVSPVAVGFTLFIELLEILIAFIQAYIFTMLTALFIGMAMHPEH